MSPIISTPFIKIVCDIACLIHFSTRHKYSHSCITSPISDTSNLLLGIRLAKLPAFICFLLSEFVPDNASSPNCLTCCLADMKWKDLHLIYIKMHHNNNKNRQFSSKCSGDEGGLEKH